MKENIERNETIGLTPEEKREKFLAVRREFGQVIFFLAFLGVGFLYFTQDYRRLNLTIECDAEKTAIHSGELYYEQGGYVFTGGEAQSSEFAHSKNHSIKLNPAQAYGFQMDYEGLWGTEEVIVQIWRYSPKTEGKGAGLVAEVRGVVYELQKKSIQTNEQGWELLELRLTLDCRTENRSLRVYCWNPTQADVYFDDLRVEIKREGIF